MLSREMADQQAVELPPYVTSDADRTRWEQAGTVARNVLGEAATPQAVWQMQRTIYHDRENYPS